MKAYLVLQLIERKDEKMNKSEIVSEYMKKGYNCAQSIIKAYASEVGMGEVCFIGTRISDCYLNEK